jgi:hypothetical protein
MSAKRYKKAHRLPNTDSPHRPPGVDFARRLELNGSKQVQHVQNRHLVHV